MGKKEEQIPESSAPQGHRYRKSRRRMAQRTKLFLAGGSVLVVAAVAVLSIFWWGKDSRETAAPLPSASQVQVERAQASLRLGNEEEAIRLLKEAIAQAPEEPDAYLLLVDLYERTRSYDEAIALLEGYPAGNASISARLAEVRGAKKRWEGWHEAARAVDEAIGAIGEASLEQQEAIEAARALYDGSPDAVKALVEKYSLLAEAEGKLSELLAQEAEKQEALAAKQKAVQDIIDAIDGIGKVTMAKEDLVREARALYDGASDETKQGVTNLDILSNAETALEKLKAAEAQREAEARAEQEAARKAAEEAKRAAEEAEKAAQEAEKNNQSQDKSEVFKLDVPYISQEGVLPTGCEIISSMMLLRYYGYSISHTSFIDNYLVRTDLSMGDDGRLYGPHPNDSFIGNPYSLGGYGCYAPVIVRSLNQITGGDKTAREVGGPSLADLSETYVKNGTPVLVWATIGMRASTPGTKWVLGDGSTFTWKRSEHCLVLVGYDTKYYYFNDPYASNGVVAYEKGLAEQRYRDMGSQAVVLE